MQFPTMGHRAWFAYQCLDRDALGRPPSFRGLERAHGLSNNALRRLIWDELTEPSYETMLRFAAALRCSDRWLWSGDGEGPVADIPVVPRPATKPSPGRIEGESVSGLSRGAVKRFEDDAARLPKRGETSRRRNARK